MCGIALVALDSQNKNDPLWGDYKTTWTSLCSACADRGPDWFGSIQLSLATKQRDIINISVATSVLHLRGPDGNQGITHQPHFGNDHSIFAWNGEIFAGLPISNLENDGLKLFNLIQDSPGDTDSLGRILSQIEGPYAFMYLHVSPKQVKPIAKYDKPGRRSLLVHWPTPSEPIFILCSSSSNRDGMKYEEVPTTGVFSVSLHGGTLLECTKNMTCTPRGASVFEGCVALNRSVPLDSEHIVARHVEVFVSKLDESVKSRVCNIPSNNTDTREGQRPLARLGILFSGGIDCTVLAYLADRHVPRNEPIDLLNVAFENPRALSGPQKNALQEARAQRKRDKKFKKEDPTIPPEIQLHTAFDVSSGLGIYDVPDRLTGLEEVEELRRLCPDRQWNFECKHEEPKVVELMHPSNTVMDLSLALALYFASRGAGTLRCQQDNSIKQYSSPAKVLLSGLGSDELLGGYSRHKQAYNRGGWDALISELQLDLDRLPMRNLGRDDRVISAHGRESRYPFLSLDFVHYLAQLPVQVKVDPRLASQSEVTGAGMGDKTLLRLAAQHLGLELASKRAKRAMQFGSRSARMEGGSEEKKGHFLLK